MNFHYALMMTVTYILNFRQHHSLQNVLDSVNVSVINEGLLVATSSCSH